MPAKFLGQMEKPDVDSIDGLSPAISIDQKTTSKNPRSTVGTVTEIHDYLRLLYARVVAHCPKCGREIQQTDRRSDGRSDALPERIAHALLAPIVRGKRANTSRFWKTWSSRALSASDPMGGEIYDAAGSARAGQTEKSDNIISRSS